MPLLAILLAILPVAQPWPGPSQVEARQTAAPRQPTDDRFKTDILLIVAHPDDDMVLSTYLARAVIDQGKRAAVVHITSGEGGWNEVARERAAALAAVRQIEARRALASIGVEHVWFLDGRDTPSQSPLLSLARWGHGAVLERIVRLVRLTRPEVVITWLPRPVLGENHGDHQAAGIMATEAFDMAGDPTAFPGQLAQSCSGCATEDLRAWQPKKLYYVSDAFDTSFLQGRGPEYSIAELSPSRKEPYIQLVMRATMLYASQVTGNIPAGVTEAFANGDVNTAVKALTESNPPFLVDPLRLVLGKSLVGGSIASDVFEGIHPGAIPFTAPRGYRHQPRPALSFALGGPWSFYQDFWRAHNVEGLAELGPAEMGTAPGRVLRVPVVMRNDTPEPVEVTLTLAAPVPNGWVEHPRPPRYSVPPHDAYEVELELATPVQETTNWQVLSYSAHAHGRSLGLVALRVQLRNGSMPQ